MTVDSIWISVEDLLPLKGERVLVVCTKNVNQCGLAIKMSPIGRHYQSYR